MRESTDTDYTTLDDVAFIAERRRVREQLERLPKRDANRAALLQAYADLTREFDRRARSAWQAAS